MTQPRGVVLKGKLTYIMVGSKKHHGRPFDEFGAESFNTMSCLSLDGSAMVSYQNEIAECISDEIDPH